MVGPPYTASLSGLSTPSLGSRNAIFTRRLKLTFSGPKA